MLNGDWLGEWPVAVRGDGVFVYDRDGRAFLDAVGGSHVVTIGHGVEAIAEAMADQAGRIAYASSRTWTNESQWELAALIGERTPPGLTWVYFTSSGSEATEAAIQLARQFHVENGEPDRYKVLGRWHSYHGATLGAVDVGGHPSHRTRLAHYLGEPGHIPSPHCLHCPLGLRRSACGLQCATDLAALIERSDPRTVSAFIAEPIGGSTSGAMVPPEGYYEAVRSVCDQFGVLFIADEVVTGFGRTGLDFGIQHWGAVPDILLASKGLTSGYAPLGAVVVHERIAAALEGGTGAVPVRMTYSGHPVSCAAGLAVQRYVSEHGLVARCALVGAYLRDRLTQAMPAFEFVSDVRGLGLLLAVELALDPHCGAPFARSERVHERVVAEAHKLGLLLMGGAGRANGTDGDHVLVSPPFTISHSECDLLVELLGQSIRNALSG